MTPKHHDLKCDPAPFAEVKAGRKLSELRLNDRDYQSGDTVTLREYDRDAGQYTGDTCGPFTIGHILRGGYFLPEGVVMFSLLASTGEGESPEGETPETDSAIIDCFAGEGPKHEWVSPAFARSLERRLRAAETELQAWKSQFGTSQLTHAIARLEAAEARAQCAEAELASHRALLEANARACVCRKDDEGAWYYGDCGVAGCFAEGGKWLRIFTTSQSSPPASAPSHGDNKKEGNDE